MRHRILIVDDEQAALNLFSSVLKDRYTVDTATSAEAALERLVPSAEYAVVLADVFLPAMSGIELLARCAKSCPDAVRVALTGDPGRETVVESVNHANVFRFVSKPIRLETMTELLEAAVRQHEAQRVERDMMETTVRTSVNLLLGVLATLDPPSFELSQRLRGTVRFFARERQLPNSSELELAAALARIGVVSVPALILNKVKHSIPLTPREAEVLSQVPALGWQLLKDIPRMERVAQIIQYQAKNYDGGGFPANAVARTDIPFGARLLRVFTDRARLEVDGVTGEDALGTLSRRRGVYDPALLAASFEQFPDRILSLVAPSRSTRTVSVDALQSGMCLVADVRTTEQLLLVTAGTMLTPLLVQRIQTHAALGTVNGPFLVQ